MGANNANGSHAKNRIRRQFTIVPATATSKYKLKCKWCDDPPKADNITQTQGPHLDLCKGWDKAQREMRGKEQQPLEFKKEAIELSTHDLFAHAIYTSTANFSLFDTPEWTTFFKKLNYTPPTRHRLAGDLLKSCYARLKLRVQGIADAATHIQIVSDGSDNINKKKVENVSFLVDGISYYWASTAIGAIKAGAVWTAANVKKHALAITKGNLKRITSFSTDTDSTQRATWNLFKDDPELSHVHSVPCNSHGIQLILKDILKPGVDANKAPNHTTIGEFFTSGPNAVVSAFSKATKQLAYLRDCMEKTIGKVVALIATVPTRWGTQVAQCASLLKSEASLKAYANLTHPDVKLSVKEDLKSDLWWQNLHALHLVLLPIHERQKMSESNRSFLHRVYPQWVELSAHIDKFAKEGTPFYKDILAYKNRKGLGGWEDRKSKQVLPIHVLAHLLLPINRTTIIPTKQIKEAEAWMVKRLDTVAYRHWVQYLNQEGPFCIANEVWEHFSSDPISFWNTMVCILPYSNK